MEQQPGRQTGEVKTRPLVSGDRGVEEVNGRRTSVTSHKVDQNWGCRTPQPDFWGCPYTHNIHSGCATGKVINGLGTQLAVSSTNGREC